MASKPLTCLLTGFDAFGDHLSNPSQTLVDTFPDMVKVQPGGRLRPEKVIHIRKLILPTAGTAAWKKLQKVLTSLTSTDENSIVIMTGFASSRQYLSIERFALNCKDYRIADNTGDQPLDKQIDKNADGLLRTGIDLIAMHKSLMAAGYPCEISNHAGTFVCNELYFRALNYGLATKQLKAVLFIHLPEPAAFVRSLAKSSKKNLANQAKKANTAEKQMVMLTDAVVTVISWLVGKK